MPSLNHAMFMGNLTRDPEIRFLADGTALCKFDIAVNERWKDKSGEKKEAVTFIPCEIWGKVAEVVGEHFHKGDPIYVEGSMKLEKWEKDGQPRSKMKLRVRQFQFIGGSKKQKDDTDTQEPEEPHVSRGPVNEPGSEVAGEEEIPF